MQTKSERLFEQFCESFGLAWARIPVASHCTPDYEVTFSGIRVIVEVKQLEQSDQERTALQEAFASGRTQAWFPSNRLRRKLENVSKQLKAALLEGIPTVLLVYDNGPFRVSLTHDRVVRALFGSIVYPVQLSKDTDELSAGEPLFGGDRGLTRTHNTSVSAVAVLEECDFGLRLRMYHNLHAAVPLAPALFDALPVEHCVRPGGQVHCLGLLTAPSNKVSLVDGGPRRDGPGHL